MSGQDPVISTKRNTMVPEFSHRPRRSCDPRKRRQSVLIKKQLAIYHVQNKHKGLEGSRNEDALLRVLRKTTHPLTGSRVPGPRFAPAPVPATNASS